MKSAFLVHKTWRPKQNDHKTTLQNVCCVVFKLPKRPQAPSILERMFFQLTVKMGSMEHSSGSWLQQFEGSSRLSTGLWGSWKQKLTWSYTLSLWAQKVTVWWEMLSPRPRRMSFACVRRYFCMANCSICFHRAKNPSGICFTYFILFPTYKPYKMASSVASHESRFSQMPPMDWGLGHDRWTADPRLLHGWPRLALRAGNGRKVAGRGVEWHASWMSNHLLIPTTYYIY